MTEKYKRLLETVTPEDTLGVLINADPDAIASALALRRLFWRKVKKALIYRINHGFGKRLSSGIGGMDHSAMTMAALSRQVIASVIAGWNFMSKRHA